MVNTLRLEMNRALQKEFVPHLRQRGFTGSLPHFRRLGERVDLLTVQFDRYGEGFVIEVARCPTTGVTTHWGQHISAGNVTARDLHPNNRRRLGSPAPGHDGHWFRFDDGTACIAVARSAVEFLDEAELWWSGC